MSTTILFLDLDGVLITTPAWRPNEIATDGYSAFNPICVHYLNALLPLANFEIWLSSSRRKTSSLEAFQGIFERRGVAAKLAGFLPDYPNCHSRKEEILTFITTMKISNFLILDDDKSLNGLAPVYKERLVLTSYFQGFKEEQLALATTILKKHTSD
ncbi:MAG: HAD domain-containing protein [Aureispira sp.]